MTRDGPNNATIRDIEIEDNGIMTGIGLGTNGGAGAISPSLGPIDKNKGI